MGDQPSPFEEDQKRSQHSEYRNQPESTHSASTGLYETVEHNANIVPSFQLGSLQVTSTNYPTEATLKQIHANLQCDIPVESQSADSQVRDAASALLSL